MRVGKCSRCDSVTPIPFFEISPCYVIGGSEQKLRNRVYNPGKLKNNG